MRTITTTEDGTPITGVSILLMTVTNEIVARCLSDRSGGYSFYLEAPGTYHIKATDLHGYHLHHILTVTVDRKSVV